MNFLPMAQILGGIISLWSDIKCVCSYFPSSHSHIHKKKQSMDILFRLKAINETHHNDSHQIKINLANLDVFDRLPLILVSLTRYCGCCVTQSGPFITTVPSLSWPRSREVTPESPLLPIHLSLRSLHTSRGLHPKQGSFCLSLGNSWGF